MGGLTRNRLQREFEWRTVIARHVRVHLFSKLAGPSRRVELLTHHGGGLVILSNGFHAASRVTPFRMPWLRSCGTFNWRTHCRQMMEPAAQVRSFPTAAGIFFGLGLGGFFDGIVLHQLL